MERSPWLNHVPIRVRKGSVGLDLDGDFLAAVTMADGRIQSAVSADLPEGAMHDGEVMDPEALGHVLKDTFRSGALPRDVRLGVANQQIVVRQLELPRIDEAKNLEAAVRFQAAEAIAMPLNEVVLDFHKVSDGTDADGNARTNVVVVAARESMIERLVAGRSLGRAAADWDRPECFRARARARVRRSRRFGARLLPPRCDHQPRHRGWLELPVHAAARHAPGRDGRGRRVRPRRGDPPLDRLLPRAAGDPARARARPVGPARQR